MDDFGVCMRSVYLNIIVEPNQTEKNSKHTHTHMYFIQNALLVLNAVDFVRIFGPIHTHSDGMKRDSRMAKRKTTKRSGNTPEMKYPYDVDV